MLGDYDTIKRKISKIKRDDYYRIGKLLTYYCTLSEIHPQTWCPVAQEMNRCLLFEDEGPSFTVPETDQYLLQACKCVTRKNIYACPLYLRFTYIYIDLMEDIDADKCSKKR